ncbi:MAG: DUF2085 domain-containing protein [Candidatus Kariarchaeaceae archaeon]
MTGIDISKLWKHNHNVSFLLGSRQLEFCARCGGMTLGLVAWVSSMIIFSGLELIVMESTGWQIVIYCVILTLPYVVLWLVQAAGKYHNTNTQRFISGLIFGGALALFAIRSDAYLITLPAALIWQAIILFGGMRLKRGRKVDWDCESCQPSLF